MVTTTKSRTKHATSLAEFNQMLLESLDESLQVTLGENVSRALRIHLEKQISLTIERILEERLDSLFASLQGLFGDGGDVVSRTIVTKLYAKAGEPLQYAKPPAQHIEELKKQLVAENG
ncbi:MAG TPA: hypothetical protein VLV31_04115 [Candidatus Acidoferrales bacterium]|nr:hypothetical protein [Candidatus Acidoferrales bacterium]